VKEDACLPLFAGAVALALVRPSPMTSRDRLLFLVAPVAVALLNLVVFYRVVVPALTDGGTATYSAFWANYGSTPIAAALGMLQQPGRVLRDTVTSGFFTIVLPPFLFLPLLGWRWIVGLVPIVVLYGASANPQLRAFGIYYSIVLVPFLTIGAAAGAWHVSRRAIPLRPNAAAAALLIAAALLVGSTHAGYSLRPWRPEVSAVRDALATVATEDLVLVQSSLYPHAGYSPRVQLLTQDMLADPHRGGAVLLLAPALSSYPLNPATIATLAAGPKVLSGDGLIVTRNVTQP